MTAIYLIRHAEAEGNVFRRAHGRYNSSVTAKGRRQIDALAERFRDIPIDALYSSDLRRTVQTAQAILKYHPDLELIPTPGLREVAMGEWEDVPWGNLTLSEPENMLNFNNNPPKWKVEGGEDFAALQERMKKTILDIARGNEGKTVACVSHGMALRAFLCLCMGVPGERVNEVPHGDNTSVSLIYVDGEEIKIDYYNDNSHLVEAGLSTFARQTWWKLESGLDTNNLSLAPVNPSAESELYLHCYREAWRAVHGSEDGFEPNAYLADAILHWRACPEAIVRAVAGRETAGLIEVDVNRCAGEGCGWICLLFVEERFRRRQLGAQLLGHAVSLFRRLGRDRLRLSVFEGNAAAIAFYREYDFRAVGSTEGVFGPLLIMERSL